MPLLAKTDSAVPTLSDSKTRQSPCQQIQTTTQQPESTPAPAGNELSSWLQQAKNADWLPWALAAGFGLLYINKKK